MLIPSYMLLLCLFLLCDFSLGYVLHYTSSSYSYKFWLVIVQYNIVMLYYWLSRFCFIPPQRLDVFQSIFASAWFFWGLFLSVVKVGQKYLLLWGYFRSIPEAWPFWCLYWMPWVLRVLSTLAVENSSQTSMSSGNYSAYSFLAIVLYLDSWKFTPSMFIQSKMQGDQYVGFWSPFF